MKARIPFAFILIGFFGLSVLCIIGIFSESTDTFSKLIFLFLFAGCSKIIFEYFKDLETN